MPSVNGASAINPGQRTIFGIQKVHFIHMNEQTPIPLPISYVLHSQRDVSSRSVTKSFPLKCYKNVFYLLQKISLYVIGMAMTFNCTGTRIAVQIGVRFNITGWLGEGATSVVLSRKKICVSGKIII